MRFLSGKLSALLLLFVLTFITSCATNPVTGKRQLALISEEKEIQMGQQYDPQVVAEFGLYENPSLQQFLNTEGQKMAAISERPNLPWKFTLVDSDVVNAFAVPGGFVYFTRGIMAHFNNEAEFAGVLGHEIGHVTARHTVAQLSRQQAGQIGLLAGMILSPEVASMGESLMQGMQLLFLKYGRDAESQSDELGVKYSTQIGYDATEMADFFGTLDRLSGGAENRAPTFTSTHPDPLNRLEKVRELAQQTQAEVAASNQKVDFEVGRESYLRRIDGMIYGEDPKNGYVEDNAFYHPDLRFQFAIPRQWRTINAPTQVQLVSPDQKAVMAMQLAQGTDTRAVAEQFIQQTKVQVSNSSSNPINGLPATTLVGAITGQDQQGRQMQIGVIASFIAYGGNTYVFSGQSLRQNFTRYQRDFETIIGSFSELRDQSKLNRQPERIKIISNPRQQTLQQALLNDGVPQARIEEVTILNGMLPNETIPAGMLFKSITIGR